jgi:hypothetical protein
MGYDAIRLGIDQLAAHWNFPTRFVRPNDITREVGNRSSSKVQK